jgi:TetR/AcrR family transcriptional regulator, mexJK operon transcriptional repressor
LKQPRLKPTPTPQPKNDQHSDLQRDIRQGPGRPLDTAKRAAILAAARMLLIERGPQVSLEAIALQAGVSKQTIYNSWPSKQALFGAMTAERLDALTEPLLQVDAQAPLRDVLESLALRYLALIYEPQSLAVLRAMAADEVWRQDYGHAFFIKGPALSYDRLSAYLNLQMQNKQLDIEDIPLATEHFFALLRGNFHMRVLFGFATPPDVAEQARRAKQGVALFLKAYQL